MRSVDRRRSYVTYTSVTAVVLALLILASIVFVMAVRIDDGDAVTSNPVTEVVPQLTSDEAFALEAEMMALQASRTVSDTETTVTSDDLYAFEADLQLQQFLDERSRDRSTP